MWERWDALDDTGNIRAGSIPNMVSFNHYAYGSVGAFFYRRILGIEAIEADYRRFAVRPVPGGNLTHAEGQIGEIQTAWRIESGIFKLDVTVPNGKEAEITLPGGKTVTMRSGTFSFEEGIQ